MCPSWRSELIPLPAPSLGHARLLGSSASPLPANLPLSSALVGSREPPGASKGEALMGWDRHVEMGQAPREKSGGEERRG